MPLLPEGVTRYSVGLHIATPCDDPMKFLPRKEQLRKLFTGGNREENEEDDDWPQYCWVGMLTTQQLLELLAEYVIDQQVPNIEQVSVNGVDRLVPCLDFNAHYACDLLNYVLIAVIPVLVGLDEAILEQVASLACGKYICR